MTALVDHGSAPTRSGPGGRWTFGYGALAAGLAAAVGLAVLSALTLLIWATGPTASDGVNAAPFRGAATIWLMGQGAPIATGVGTLVLPPLVVTAAVAVVTARLAGWAVRSAGAHQAGPALVTVAGFVLGHAVLTIAAATLSSRAGAGVGVGDALGAAVPFALACALIGAAPQTWSWARVAARRGAMLAVAARAAAIGAAILLGGATVILLASLAVHHAEMSAAFGLVGGGFGGALGTALLCVALLPNAALWVTAFAAGPGFALGTDAGLGTEGLREGALPGLPLLAALPAPGPLPHIAYPAFALPALAGAAIGWLARDSEVLVRSRDRILVAAATGAGCGVAIGLLAGFSGGSAQGRLASFGPEGHVVAAALAGQLAVAAAFTAALRAAYDSVAVGREIRAPLIPGQSRARHDDLAASSDAAGTDALSTPDMGPTAIDGAGAVPAVDAEADPDLEDTQDLPVIRPAGTGAAADEDAAEPVGEDLETSDPTAPGNGCDASPDPGEASCDDEGGAEAEKGRRRRLPVPGLVRLPGGLRVPALRRRR